MKNIHTFTAEMNIKVIFLRFFVLIFSFLLLSCGQKDEISFENIDFCEGDLIFRKGTGTKSRAVLHADSLGIYSHVGIVVLRDSVFQIVHITPGERESGETEDRIKAEPVADFWRKDRASHGAIYRLRNNDSGKKASAQALRLLKKGVLFDHNYTLNDTTEMYCTEFVHYVYGQSGKDIGRRSELNMPKYTGTYIFPSDIYANDVFVLIYKF